ncbi:nicotinate (nicotinamide) nucleotide adenylyltransferase [Labilibacter marinus]|uniref:nicotinate (nicotinamide) nucleotide adenylyltransferase n=1 Tax=Labilibacter marinus TaxID=1477105 RepID=UPI00094F7A32|nr:nicotinate (nicotinamide) nucleotide adenylyltransferase [Labilibacter marinus]
MTKQASIGLYFGSFNPVHIGHLALANYVVENSHLQEIWFVVSPQNPYKKSSELIEAKHRLRMLELSTQAYANFKVCDIELQLPTPSYTYNTLRELSKLHPDNNFTIIMGADNLPALSRWKNSEEILSNYSFMVYPRPGYEINEDDILENVSVIEAPVFEMDSTSIRKGLKEGKNYPYLIPQEAYKYIIEKKLY